MGPNQVNAAVKFANKVFKVQVNTVILNSLIILITGIRDQITAVSGVKGVNL